MGFLTQTMWKFWKDTHHGQQKPPFHQLSTTPVRLLIASGILGLTIAEYNISSPSLRGANGTKLMTSRADSWNEVFPARGEGHECSKMERTFGQGGYSIYCIAHEFMCTLNL